MYIDTWISRQWTRMAIRGTVAPVVGDGGGLCWEPSWSFMSALRADRSSVG